MSENYSLAELRTQHPELVFEGWDVKSVADETEITYHLLLKPGISFAPKLILPPVLAAKWSQLSSTDQNWWLLHLGLAELPSYWKLAACPRITITAPGNETLTSEQLNWWRDLFLKGLGEYYFVNNISSFADPDFLTITTSEGVSSDPDSADWQTSHPLTPSATSTEPSFLIPLGGGKDSVVTTELLKQYYPVEASTILLLNPTKAAQDVAATSGLTTITVRRVLDPQLGELNRQGYLNGHTPFSAYLAFVSTLVAHLLQIKTVVLSNEHSANESNITFHGLEINHQYSKSLAFETAFSEYLQLYGPSQAPHYLSLLRPISELQIGSLFAQLTAKRSVAEGLRTQFRSCNRGSKQNIWCGECPKCLFAYMMLAPFLGPKVMVDIFGQDLYAKPELLETALELVGKGLHKPLECVGLYEESLMGLYMSCQVWRRELPDQPLPTILEHFATKIFPQETALNQSLHHFKTFWAEHRLPTDLAHLVEQAVTTAQKEWPL
jgi:hypothetical protein